MLKNQLHFKVSSESVEKKYPKRYSYKALIFPQPVMEEITEFPPDNRINFLFFSLRRTLLMLVKVEIGLNSRIPPSPWIILLLGECSSTQLFFTLSHSPFVIGR